MRLTVFSHKPCWPSTASPVGYATDGGFALQMGALASVFDEVRLVVPVSKIARPVGEVPFVNRRLVILPLSELSGTGIARKLWFGCWALGNGRRILWETLQAEAVHTPIPGDVGTIGMLLAWALRKPLLVRHCGNWTKPVTRAEKFWRGFMERFAGGLNVMLATGGAPEAPSPTNPNVNWIFSSSLTCTQLRARAKVRRCPPPGSLRLAMAARQEPAKGGGVIIQALPELAKRFPNVHLDLIGDGSALPEFKALARKLGVSERVTFHGKLSHDSVLERLSGADLFCYPTRASDGFPKAVLEALASGLPVVATRVSVLPELLGNGAGILISCADSDALVQGILGVFARPGDYEAMSSRAAAVAARYSLEAWAEEIVGRCRHSWGHRFREVEGGS